MGKKRKATAQPQGKNGAISVKGVAPSVLTPKQAAFAKEYLVDLNATQAAIRAGYSEKTARSQGQRLLTKADVQAAIQEGMNKRADRLEITADRVLQEIAKLSFFNIRDIFQDDGSMIPISELPPEVTAAIQAIEHDEVFSGLGEERKKIGRTVKVKFADKKGNLELLGRHLKLFTDKVEFPDANGNPQKISSDTERSARLLFLLEQAEKRAKA